MNSSPADALTLDPRKFAAALRVLEAEQRTLLPSPVELKRFRILSVLTILLGVSLVGIFVSVDSKGNGAALVVAVFVLIATTIFSVLNLPLLRKLWEMEVLRRRLHLAKLLKPRFRAEWRQRLVVNYLTIGAAAASFGLLLVYLVGMGILEPYFLLALLLWLWAATGLIRVAVKLRTSGEGWKKWGLRALAILLGVITVAPLLIPMGGCVVLPMLLLIPLLCSSILTWFLVRQGMQRLAVVQRLQDSLWAAEPSAEAGEETSGIPEADYDLIARLERGQIMLDRQRSIQAARKEEEAESFVVQRSNRLRADLADLDAVSRAKVERLILRLTADPEPSAATLDEESGLYRLSGEDAPYAIVYQVDREATRVRIFGVEAAGDSASTTDSR